MFKSLCQLRLQTQCTFPYKEAFSVANDSLSSSLGKTQLIPQALITTHWYHLKGYNAYIKNYCYKWTRGEKWPSECHLEKLELSSFSPLNAQHMLTLQLNQGLTRLLSTGHVEITWVSFNCSSPAAVLNRLGSKTEPGIKTSFSIVCSCSSQVLLMWCVLILLHEQQRKEKRFLWRRQLRALKLPRPKNEVMHVCIIRQCVTQW